MNPKKILIAVVVAILVAIGIGAIKNSAGATDDPCVPATPGQHYSWTGGHLSVDNPPTEIPPSDNWQANTTQEPHDNGQGNPATWVNDSLHYTANSQGHASWFYYVHPVPESGDCDPDEPEIIEVPAAPEIFNPCGLNNNGFFLPGDTDVLVWTYEIPSNDATATIVAENTTFPDGSTSVTFELPSDMVDRACPEEPNDPEDPSDPDEPNTPQKRTPDVPTVVTAGL